MTEASGSGGPNLLQSNQNHGIYLCIKCRQPLYPSIQKVSSTDWPLFDPSIRDTDITTVSAEIKTTVLAPDPNRTDGVMEIQCGKCYVHLGHLFHGPHKKGHCINSNALIFQPLGEKEQLIRYAGVIPCTRDAEGEWRILVGQEAFVKDYAHALAWSDFGGGQETCMVDTKIYAENVLQVAAREFEEEIMGFFGCKGEMEVLLQDRGLKFELQNGTVVEYLVPMRWKEVKNIPFLFRNVRKHFLKCSTEDEKKFVTIDSCPKGTMEKMDIEWVKLKDVVSSKNTERKWRPSFLKSIQTLLQIHAFDDPRLIH